MDGGGDGEGAIMRRRFQASAVIATLACAYRWKSKAFVATRLPGCAAFAALAMTWSAMAADLPVKVPEYGPAPSIYTWTGCSIGVHGGGGWGLKDWHLAETELGVVRISGFLAGAQVGCDYQVGAWVFGVEGQFSWANLKGQTLTSTVTPFLVPLSKVDRLAMATGRVGYAIDRVLPYVKAGFAWAHENHELDIGFPAAAPAFVGSGNVVGWTAGIGVEVAFLPNWSWKAEYSYLSFGNNGFNLSCIAPTCTAGSVAPFSINQSVQTVVVGLNYRFGPAGEVAKF